MKMAKEVQDNIRFFDHEDPNVIVYEINGAAVNDTWKKICVIYNGSEKEKDIPFRRGHGR